MRARGRGGEEEGELTVAVGIGQWGAGRMSGTTTTQGRRRRGPGGGGAPATVVWTGRRPGRRRRGRRGDGVQRGGATGRAAPTSGPQAAVVGDITAGSRRRRGGVEAAGQRRGGAAGASGEERGRGSRARAREREGIGLGRGGNMDGGGTILMAHHPSVRHKYIHTNGAPHRGAPLVFFL